jgi:hypothetical protein
MEACRHCRSGAGTAFVRPILRFLQRRIDRHLPAEDRAIGRAAILARVWDAFGQHFSSLLTTPDLTTDRAHGRGGGMAGI